ncbi:sigma-54-dependent Fis family transcriptional regulator [Roseateles violae]|uniref:Helix-turn-helix domain-containing protein n=1 Tax=Roseateles violae TaxID=3058042 RepID=A0ABT8DWI2_9BURK|nr:helix-turn-helix domain-containing protein [Pelomonas sp. PFR6]MDN3920536.1 helix-turn-helix domain-containing protein [Pelomonas sp. PFR6]
MATSRQAPATAAVQRLLADARHAETIAGSHERSAAFGLLPQTAPDLHRLGPAQLQELRERNARLCAQALPVMEMLYEQLTHAQSMVLLTDASGVVLHALGDAGFLQRAQQVALAPGALWAEADKGTNAVGTVLMTEAPTLVHGQEHYLRAMQFLTCSAAPIFDHKGALLGVIDVSGDRRSYHPHTLALAGMAARLIENQWFADRFRADLRLHFHSSAAGLGTLHEGVLALAEDGRVLGANRRAAELLARSATQLKRESVQSLFDQGLAQLIDGAQQHPEHGLALRHAHGEWQAKLSLGLSGRSGRSTVASVQALPATEADGEPPIVLPPAPLRVDQSSALRTLREAELRAIEAAVRASAGNLSLAARQLGIGRSTLYRKLRGSGIGDIGDIRSSDAPG